MSLVTKAKFHLLKIVLVDIGEVVNVPFTVADELFDVESKL